MSQLSFNVSDDRRDRIQNLLRFRGQTIEQFFEPWLADADTHMGHNPSDTPEDQQAAADRFARKATKAEGDRAEAKRIQEEAETPKNKKDGTILLDANSGKPAKEGKA
jgi:hypothetical protein